MSEDLALTYIWYGGIYDLRLGCFDMKFLGKQEIEMSEDRSEGLKSCPFCGSEAKLIPQGENCRVFCCDFTCKVAPHLLLEWEDPFKAVEAWNTRPRESALLDWVLERAKEKMLYASDGGGVLYSEDLETIINEAKGRM